MISRNSCAVCNGEFQNIYTLPNTPISFTCTNKPHIITEQLSYVICNECRTIQLSQLIPLNVLYAENHNFVSVGEVWSNYFKLFCAKITNIITNKNILEIGCPSGKIANKLDNYNKWYIVEPNINTNIECKSNIFYIEQFFDEHFSIDDNIDIIVHSHLFEHIYDPNVFLKKSYEILNDNGEMFFGIPNMQYIAEHNLCPFFGVMFEHNIFYNKENISYLLKKHHFEIIEIYDYLNHSILFHVKKCSQLHADNTEICKITQVSLSDFLNGVQLTHDFIIKCKQIIHDNDIKVYIFGASYNTQLLLTMGLSDLNISGILDNCISKQNKYLFGHDILIQSPNVIANEHCIVILRNGYYSGEIAVQLQNINPNTVVIM